MQLLTTKNPKTAKSEGSGYLTAILHLAPYNLSGRNVCPWASPGCAAACLNTAGRGGIGKRDDERQTFEGVGDISLNTIQRARIARTRFFFANRSGFIAQLRREIAAHVRRATRHGLRPAVRLNGTSDLRWERLAREIFDAFPGVRFYDYTKGAERAKQAATDPSWPTNYALTFSRTEANDADCADVLEAGGTVAVVFSTRKGRELPRYWGVGPIEWAVVDGDASDLRFLDPRGVVVGLRAKGRGKADTSGFVVAAETLQ